MSESQKTEWLEKLATKWREQFLAAKSEDDFNAVFEDVLSHNWILEYLECQRRAERAERLLTDKLTPKEVGRAHHIADLEEKNVKLKSEVRIMQEKAEVFNDQLYATGLIVNCTGCMPGAPANYENLTEDKVREVEQIAQRLRTWWNNNRHHIKA
jgi:hypothetical protein